MVIARTPLHTRVLSALVLIPFGIGTVWLGGRLYQIVLLSLGIIMAFELVTLYSKRSQQKNPLCLHIPIFGVAALYMTYACISFYQLQHKPFVLLWMFFLVWVTDISAYFIGSYLQGPRLAPHISPNKTWSGFLGGVILGTGVGYASAQILGLPSISWFMCLFLCLVAIAGDLLESAFKRYVGVKDTGCIIPGHGGLLDRLDSLLSTAIAVQALHV